MLLLLLWVWVRSANPSIAGRRLMLATIVDDDDLVVVVVAVASICIVLYDFKR